jgi:dipeptidyl aminopeptidase/acylaminoacyl peptidase
MATRFPRARTAQAVPFVLVLLCLGGVRARPGEVVRGQPTEPFHSARGINGYRDASGDSPEARARFERMLREQAATDDAWRAASQGWMRMEKITYRSAIDDLDIPAFVFEPLTPARPASRPALVWVHENIRGHLYEHFIPYVREATSRGYVVIAPEYRGSIGYGQTLYDAIDYGGAEVDDVVTAATMLRERYPSVDPQRVGVIGWSHGGLIALLAVFRHPSTFEAAATIAPVVNLFQRLAKKGVEKQRAAIDPANRIGGTPSEQPSAYVERSPLFHVDRLDIPLLVHAAANDEDVEIEEAMQLIDALRARKPSLSNIKLYDAPAGGHQFDRLVRPHSWEPRGGPEQLDSWKRVWQFFDRHLAGASS